MASRLHDLWVRTPVPVETLAGVVAGAVAQRLRPLRLPAPARPVGLALVLTGLALVVEAVRERGPGSVDAPAGLTTEGLHGRSRNPMYVGLTLAQVGLAGATRNGWALVLSPVSAAALHLAVLREERWLRNRFGAAYQGYAARVPRYW